MNFLASAHWFYFNWRSVVEVLILAFLFYYVYVYFKNTPGARILSGLLILLVALTLATQLLQLEVIGSLLKGFSLILTISLVILFQPELRRGLAKLGSNPLFFFSRNSADFVDHLSEAVQQLSNRRIGALFAIERNISLDEFRATGIFLDAKFSPELMLTIFNIKAPLHDGGIILNENRVIAAGCVFPLSQHEIQDRSIGLRHRAAMGVSEESDTIAVVVSEETGRISLAHEGKLEKNIPAKDLSTRLNSLLYNPEKKQDDEKNPSSKNSDT